MKHHASLPPIAIGVGLRHQHIAEALDAPASVDFVEVHSENFFRSGRRVTSSHRRHR